MRTDDHDAEGDGRTEHKDPQILGWGSRMISEDRAQ
jgi:hypothetical protein